MKPMKAVELLIEKIQKDYQNDVSLVMIMGSAIYNETHSRSDIDMFYVPKTEKGYHLGFTCIIDGIGYDFWPISWERLTGIANHKERITSIITEGQVMYCASDEDMERLNTLKAIALDVSHRKRFIDMADEVIKNACVELVELEASSQMRDVRFYSIKVIYAIGRALALINDTTIKRGRGKLKGELLAMPVKPQNFEQLYDTVFFSNHVNTVKEAMQQLFVSVKDLVHAEKNKMTDKTSFSERWSQLYEELINAYNKIGHACEIGDPVTALFAAVELEDEIASASDHTEVDVKILPDLVAAYDPKDLASFEKAAKQHKMALEKLLDDKGVLVRRFADFNELKVYFEGL